MKKSETGILEDDAKDFHTMLDCMVSVGFGGDKIAQVLDITVAILNLGNIEFEKNEKDITLPT